MNTLIIIAMTLLFGYTITIFVVNRSIPSSLSATVYALPQSGAWLWTLVIGAAAGMTLPAILDITPDYWRFIAFIAIAGLIAVAFCPLVPDKTDINYKIHISGAVLAAVCSQVLIAICQPWLLLCWVPWVVAFAWITKDSKWRTKTFWAEMVCFASTFAYSLIGA